MKLPHEAFNRGIGVFAGKPFDPDGNLLGQSDFEERKGDGLPNSSDADFITSLMVAVTEPGKICRWIAPPKVESTTSRVNLNMSNCTWLKSTFTTTPSSTEHEPNKAHDHTGKTTSD